MPKVRNVEKRIWDVEDFEVVFMKDGRDVRSDKGNIPQYEKERAAKDSMTVSEWKKKRFHTQYAGYDVVVLDGDGNPVPGQTTLGRVRDSYTSDDEE